MACTCIDTRTMERVLGLSQKELHAISMTGDGEERFGGWGVCVGGGGGEGWQEG